MGTSMVLNNLLKESEQTILVDRSVLERLLEGSDRQLNLINSLLEAHASEIQGIPLNCEPKSLSDLVEAVRSDLEPVLKQNHITLINRMSADLPLVNVDTTQLWRVFTNLITNALKHNPHGITITLNAEVGGDGETGFREHHSTERLDDDSRLNQSKIQNLKSKI
ncbi:MAG: hypothetical protein HC866_26130 [Leptolyngbyaceae cyanobacterium RU_5_1]|nr:hypothetical protein [Leptolyngbyaceae cyanobacterium RU_5_1]